MGTCTPHDHEFRTQDGFITTPTGCYGIWLTSFLSCDEISSPRFQFEDIATAAATLSSWAYLTARLTEFQPCETYTEKTYGRSQTAAFEAAADTRYHHQSKITLRLRPHNIIRIWHTLGENRSSGQFLQWSTPGRPLDTVCRGGYCGDSTC